MLISLRELQQNHNCNIKGVIHIGGHIGEEAKGYADLGVEKVLWIEANPNMIPILTKETAQFKGQEVFNLLVSDVDDKDTSLLITNNNASSSSLELEDHLLYHQGIFVVDSIKMQTKRIDTFFKENNIECLPCNFLNIDIQGAELLALKGMGTILQNIEWIYVEINLTHLYKNCALLHQLDFYLYKKGFIRAQMKLTRWNWGDAFYRRKKNSFFVFLYNIMQAFLLEIQSSVSKMRKYRKT